MSTPEPAEPDHDHHEFAGRSVPADVSDLDPVWRALSDPTRRAILDQLRERPQNTTALCDRFDHLSRQAIIKHLKALERAGLIWVESKGRERINHLDVSPIEAIYQRWMRPYHSYWLGHLHRLADEIERGESERAQRTQPKRAGGGTD